MKRPDAILIAGPTASGKSALAIELAERHDGVVVNADSMQVYDALAILTARPSTADSARVEHRLYGHVPADAAYSTGAWYRDIAGVLDNLKRDGRLPIVVGGTGLYFGALLGGLSEMPAVPDAIRQTWRGRLEERGAPGLHAVLAERDPKAAAVTRDSDGQRIVRALEVHEASGRSIVDFWNAAGEPLIAAEKARRIVVMPERTELDRRIARRFDAMVDAGAIDEVRALLDRHLDPTLPIMKAIGVRELQGVIEGKFSVAEARVRAATASRQYAKRQMTWFRNRLSDDWLVLEDAGAAL